MAAGAVIRNLIFADPFLFSIAQLEKFLVIVKRL